MKLQRSQIVNGLWILAICLILFTPVAFHFRVFIIGQISSFFPVEVVEEGSRKVHGDYNWQLVDMQGNPKDFHSFKGEVVVLNIWATWCPPCVAEFPSLVKLHQDYGDRVAFAFVAEDERERVAAFLKKKGYGLPVYFSRSTPPKGMEGNSIPKTLILGRNGEIAVSEVGAANWNATATRELLDNLLGE